MASLHVVKLLLKHMQREKTPGQAAHTSTQSDENLPCANKTSMDLDEFTQ